MAIRRDCDQEVLVAFTCSLIAHRTSSRSRDRPGVTEDAPEYLVVATLPVGSL